MDDKPADDGLAEGSPIGDEFLVVRAKYALVTPADAAHYLRVYARHRAARQLPPGWADDTTGLAAWARCSLTTDRRGYPEVAFAPGARSDVRPDLVFTSGPRRVEVELDTLGRVAVDVKDGSGEGFSVPELLALVDDLVGVRDLDGLEVYYSYPGAEPPHGDDEDPPGDDELRLSGMPPEPEDEWPWATEADLFVPSDPGGYWRLYFAFRDPVFNPDDD